MRLTSDLGDRARKIKMILMDVDGVLTDARIILQAEVDEAKGFDARDGVGIRLAQRAGLITGVITGRLSIATSRRTRELSMEEFHQRVFRKSDVLDAILKTRRLRLEQVCFIGDDLVDVPVMTRVGMAAAPADARQHAMRAAQFVTAAPGGRGSVREVIEFILKAQNRWAKVTHDYLQGV